MSPLPDPVTLIVPHDSNDVLDRNEIRDPALIVAESRITTRSIDDPDNELIAACTAATKSPPAYLDDSRRCGGA